MENKTELQCSFCLKKQNEVEMIVSGAKANICEECVSNASKIISLKSCKDDSIAMIYVIYVQINYWIVVFFH